MFRIKRRKSDTLFTKFIRLRDKYTCFFCGKIYYPDNCRNLVVSHYWGRARENTRFDPHNVVASCQLPCHNFYGHGEGREEYKKKMIEWLGQEEFDRLEIRAHQSKKRDDVMDIFIIEQEIKCLQDTVTIAQ